MDYNGFEKSLKKSKIYPIYTVYGDETFLIKQSLSLIKDKVLGKNNVDISLIELRGQDVTFGQILDELWSVPLLGAENRRLIIIEDAGDFIKSSKKPMKKYFDRPSPYASLVLICSSIESWIKKEETDKAITIECKKLQNRQLQSWIVARGRCYKKKITDAASRVLIEDTGNDLNLLDNQILKLATYVGDNETINEDDVVEIIFDVKKRSVFELTDAMADKDIVKALRTLDKLITLGEELTKIIFLLAWQLKRIWTAKRIVTDCGTGSQETVNRLQTELKVNQYFMQKFLKQVERFNENDLQTKYGFLTEADVKIKTSSIDPRIVVECLLIKLCK